MPDDSKKNQDKKRSEPKEQRKPRNARNQACKVDKKAEKVEESRSAPKVTVPQKPPVYEDPGPEFYKNLKRETEEILKITEEENSKYKKKEIQSNWSKYEMPIESYEDIEEHDAGADYEKLIQAPLSIGGHFQFKHEKSWDVNTGPSLYDKYFDINMDNLSLAVSTIPFYERNGVDESLFSETDMLSMNNRAIKYKQKYYKDKSYSTAETEAQDKILNSLKESLSKDYVDNEKGAYSVNKNAENPENVQGSSSKNHANKENIERANSVEEISETPENVEDRSVTKDIVLDFTLAKTDIPSPIHSNIEIDENKNKLLENKVSSAISMEDINDPVLDNTTKAKDVPVDKIVVPPIVVTETKSTNSNEPVKVPTASKSTDTKIKDIPVEAKKNPVIESPEDLEKWLDDFLDG